MRVLVVTEYYPRRANPALGIWAHRQAVASAAAGADVRVVVLHRPIPPLSAVRHRDLGRAWSVIAQPGSAVIDGLAVRYLRYLSPPRGVGYGSWGAWAAPVLRRALREDGPFDLVHAHYASPAGEAVRRAAASTPLIVSVHGHDVHGPHAGGPAVRATLAHARLVLANSAGTARRSTALGAERVEVVHLGTDLPALPREPDASVGPGAVGGAPVLVTVADLVPRKRHADVIAALPRLRRRWPDLRYVIVGAGPERERLEALARSLGVADAVVLRGALAHADAVAIARQATVFVLPSVAEAFGVAYIEAMAGGVPVIGCAGEDGPEEIAAAGGGIVLVSPRAPDALAETIEALLDDDAWRCSLGRTARATVASEFTWTRCGEATVAAYRSVLDV